MSLLSLVSKNRLLHFMIALSLFCLTITVFLVYKNIKKIEHQKSTSLQLMIAKGTVVSAARTMQMSAGGFVATGDKKWIDRAREAKSNFENIIYNFGNTRLGSESEYYIKDINEHLYQFEISFEEYLKNADIEQIVYYDKRLNQIIEKIDESFADLLLHLHEDQLLIQRQAEITQHDEILTMSTYISSFDTTQLSYWEQNYNNSDLKLLKALDNLSFALNLPQTSNTSKTNDQLLEIEKSAFDHVRNNQSGLALKLLSSENYRQLKYDYYMQSAKSNGLVTAYLSKLKEEAIRPFKLFLILGTLLLLAVIYFAFKIAQSEKKVVETTEENQELEQFAHIVSHDLKAPLRNISGFISLLERKDGSKFSEDSQEYITIVKDQTIQMGNLIDGVLALTQVDSEKQQIEKISVLRQLKLIVEPYIQGNKKVKFNLPEKEFDMTCSKIKFEQIFQNLISNAVKYNDKEVVEINISAKEINEKLTFNVKDNGPGIEEEYSDRIFGIFQTLGPKTKDSTGIGLAIVKKIVDSVGGQIKLLTTPSAIGACFEVTLPKEWT